MNLIVCFSSRDFVDTLEPTEFLVASQNVTAESLPFLSLEFLRSRFASWARRTDATARADTNSVSPQS